jgi:hypothetical protein
MKIAIAAKISLDFLRQSVRFGKYQDWNMCARSNKLPGFFMSKPPLLSLSPNIRVHHDRPSLQGPESCDSEFEYHIVDPKEA